MKSFKIKTLMYHDIVDDKKPDSSGLPGKGAAIYKLAPEVFKLHLSAIAKNVKKPPITFEELDQYRSNPFDWQITFDDGGIGAYTHTADLLEQYGWRGHFFIPTNFINQPTFLATRQIQEISQRGHVIGSHSCSHPVRIGYSSFSDILAEWTAEWTDSITLLSDILEKQVTVASIPGGFYTKRVAQAAARAKIKVLFTSEPTSSTKFIDGCLVLGRYTIKRNTAPSKAAALAIGRPSQCLTQWLHWNSKKILKIILGNRYGQIRKKLLHNSKIIMKI